MSTKRAHQADDDAPDAEVKRARVDQEHNISIYVVGPTKDKDRVLWVSNYAYSSSDPEFQRQFALVYNELVYSSKGMDADLFHYVRLWIEKHYYTEVGIPSKVGGRPLYFRYVVLHPPTVEELARLAVHILGEHEPVDSPWPVRCPEYHDFAPSERARFHEAMRYRNWDFHKADGNFVYFSRAK